MALTQSTPTERAVRERIESLIAYGRPTCSVCYHLDPEDRLEYWPSPAYYAVVSGEDCLADRHTTLCAEHREAVREHAPEATHVATVEAERAPDHHMKTAHRLTVSDVTSIDG
jgi:hypothetical protein